MTTGLLELGEILLSASQRRLEVVSANVANATTPGFKRTDAFENALSEAVSRNSALSTVTDFDQGALRATGRPFDLAIAGPGFFQLRGENGAYYSRSGQFERLPDGRLANAQGFVLQTSDGQDVVVRGARADILEDGAILENGLPVGRVGVFAPADDVRPEALGGTLFSVPEGAMHEVAAPLLRQGMLEGANVEMAGEMLHMMSALREAEIGARVVQAYDTLIDQSISTFGRAR